MVTAELSKCPDPSLTTASATARSLVLSMSTRLTARNNPASRAIDIDTDNLRSVASSWERSGRYVTMLTVSVGGGTIEFRFQAVG